jgi:hypothetical protein
VIPIVYYRTKENKMPFTKGKPKTGGRKVGTPNKTTANLRGLIDEFLTNNFDEVCHEFTKLETRDKINAYLKLLEFGLPKLTRTQSEVTGKDGGSIQTLIRFIDDTKDEVGVSD